MKTILSLRRDHYLARVSIFLITVGLIAGMVGCVGVKYDLTIASTTGGSVEIPGEGTSTHLEGELVTLLATPVEGYRFVIWYGDVDDIADVNDFSTTIKVTGNYSIKAYFEEIPSYNLTISSTEGGSVTEPSGNFTYDGRTVVSLAARRDAGYKFVSWTGDVGKIDEAEDAETTITMEGNYEITANFKEEEAVTIVDPYLNAAIREALEELDIPEPERLAIYPLEIYPSDLKEIEELEVYGQGITDLTGLEQCTNLDTLRLKDNQISDISTLANLIGLTDLSIGGNQISSVPPLPNLDSLTELNLSNNQISDISSLANLTGLTELYLGSNNISDISSLANLPELRYLYLEHNQISDISSLANLESLKILRLWSNNISDISPLANLTKKLTNLSLGSNQISDISPLANLTDLTDLSLEHNQISNLSPLEKLTRLKNLSLVDNKISNISPLEKLTRLKNLFLVSNQISDIGPLVYNPGLSQGDKVYLWDNPLSSDSISYYIPQLEARSVTVEY